MYMYNDDEVRYAICDPLISMLCDCHDYELKLEESISDTLEENDDDNDIFISSGRHWSA